MPKKTLSIISEEAFISGDTAHFRENDIKPAYTTDYSVRIISLDFRHY